MQRFAEDHLRMLRAVRFAARFSLSIDPGTREAIVRAATHLTAISPERIWMELQQILANPSRADGWILIRELSLADKLADGWHPDDTRHPLAVGRLSSLPDRTIAPVLGLAAILADEAPDAVRRIGKALRMSNRDIEVLVWLVRSLDAGRRAESLQLADLKALLAHDQWTALTSLLRADLLARGDSLHVYEMLIDRTSQIDPERIAPPPLLTGDRLQELGIAPGPKLGAILSEVYRAQQNETITTRAQADALARKLAAGDRTT
jgi:tRNA nucleotidyltransferase/poly(A) polymerase